MLLPGDPAALGELLKALGAFWVFDKATGSIISEYGKRFWFKHVHKQKDKTEQLLKELRDARDRYDSISGKTEALLLEKERLEGEVIRLRVENDILRKNGAPPKA